MVDFHVIKAPFWVQILVYTLSSMLIVLVVVTAALYYHRRHFFPLKGRGYRLVLLMLGAMTEYAIVNIISTTTYQTFPSWLFSASFAVSVVPVAVVYVFRAWRLLFAFKLTQKMVEMNELIEKGMFSQIASLQQNDWYLKNRHWLHGWRFISAFCTVLFTTLAMSGAIIGIIRRNGDNELGVAIVVSIPMSTALVAAWGLRSFAGDGHFMKLELTEVGAFSLAIIISYAGIFFFDKGLVTIGPALTMLAYANIAIFSGLMPVWWSYKIERQDSLTANTQQSSFLKTLLHDAFGVESFMKFAKSEFSTENVLFWRDMEKVQELTSLTGARAYLKRIYSLYIDDSSSIQVNLPATVRDRLDTAYLELTKEDNADEKDDDKVKIQETLQPWLDAQNDIYVLMRKDSLPRYLASVYYKEYLKQKGTHVDLQAASEKLGRMDTSKHSSRTGTLQHHQSKRRSLKGSRASADAELIKGKEDPRIGFRKKFHGNSSQNPSQNPQNRIDRESKSEAVDGGGSVAVGGFVADEIDYTNNNKKKLEGNEESEVAVVVVDSSAVNDGDFDRGKIRERSSSSTSAIALASVHAEVISSNASSSFISIS